MKAQRRGVFRVSDHALLRFMERAGGLDVEAMRAAVEHSMTRAAAAADQIGARRYIIVADGLGYVVRDSVVVTVLDGAWPRSGFHGGGEPS